MSRPGDGGNVMYRWFVEKWTGVRWVVYSRHKTELGATALCELRSKEQPDSKFRVTYR